MKKEVVIGDVDSGGATPIAQLVQLANSFNSSVYLTKEGIKVNAKSIMGMMNLVFTAGTVISIEVTGDDEEKAIEEIEKFLLDLSEQ